MTESSAHEMMSGGAGPHATHEEKMELWAHKHEHHKEQPPCGASTAFLTPKPSFFNVLYTHTLFGPMSAWGSTAPKLPPVNSVAGMHIPPEQRMAARTYGYDEFLPQWGALGPGGKAMHCGGHAQHMRAKPRAYSFPSSPSMHCQPSPPLPEIAAIRARATTVPASLHPQDRLPAHTSRRRAVELAAYGPKPDEKAAMRAKLANR